MARTRPELPHAVDLTVARMEDALGKWARVARERGTEPTNTPSPDEILDGIRAWAHAAHGAPDAG